MTTSYEVSKKLKAFLGESVPVPIGDDYREKHWYWKHYEQDGAMSEQYMDNLYDNCRHAPSIKEYPAYTLEDILSRPFCEVFMTKVKPFKWGEAVIDSQWRMCTHIASQYNYGGFPAVEKELFRLMEDK